MSVKLIDGPEAQQPAIARLPENKADLFYSKFDLSLPHIAKQVNRFAIPALVLCTVYMLPVTDALKPGSFNTCINKCYELASEGLLQQCLFACHYIAELDG